MFGYIMKSQFLHPFVNRVPLREKGRRRRYEKLNKEKRVEFSDAILTPFAVETAFQSEKLVSLGFATNRLSSAWAVFLA